MRTLRETLGCGNDVPGGVEPSGYRGVADARDPLCGREHKSRVVLSVVCVIVCQSEIFLPLFVFCFFTRRWSRSLTPNCCRFTRTNRQLNPYQNCNPGAKDGHTFPWGNAAKCSNSHSDMKDTVVHANRRGFDILMTKVYKYLAFQNVFSPVNFMTTQRLSKWAP